MSDEEIKTDQVAGVGKDEFETKLYEVLNRVTPQALIDGNLAHMEEARRERSVWTPKLTDVVPSL